MRDQNDTPVLGFSPLHCAQGSRPIGSEFALPGDGFKLGMRKNCLAKRSIEEADSISFPEGFNSDLSDMGTCGIMWRPRARKEMSSEQILVDFCMESQ